MSSISNAPNPTFSFGTDIRQDAGMENLFEGKSEVVHGMRQAADMSIAAVIGQLQHQISGADKQRKTEGVARLDDMPALRAPRPVAVPLSGDMAPAQELSNGALMAWLIETLQEKGFQFSESWLTTDLAVYKLARKNQDSLLRESAKEVEERAANAKKASGAMGCAEKIFAGVIVALSLAAGVFTGGATLVLAGAGLALFAADLVTEAATGTSLSGRVLSPIIDNVFMPIAKAVGDIVTKGLVLAGVDPDTAAIVGSALGAVITVIALIALVYVAKGPASKLLSAATQVVKKMIGKVVAKVAQGMAGKTGQSLISKAAQSGVGNAVKTSATQVAKVSKSVSQVASKTVEKAVGEGGEVLTLQLRRTMEVSTVTNSAIQSGGNVYIGVQDYEISKETSKQIENDLQKDLFQNLLDRAVKTWVGFNNTLQAECTKGLEALQNEASVATFVTGNVRAQAA
jgi:invasin B